MSSRFGGVNKIGKELHVGVDSGTSVNFKYAKQTLSAMTGASVTTTGLIPDGATVYGVVVKVITAITGASAFTIGDGTDVDKWGTGVALTAGTTTTSAGFTAGSPTWYGSATECVLTATTSNFTAGAVEITAIYSEVPALA